VDCTFAASQPLSSARTSSAIFIGLRKRRHPWLRVRTFCPNIHLSMVSCMKIVCWLGKVNLTTPITFFLPGGCTTS